jgi:hypothetical protein
MKKMQILLKSAAERHTSRTKAEKGVKKCDPEHAAR